MAEPKLDANPTTLDDMPDWWDPKMEPRRLREGILYRGKDGHWRHSDGRLANRDERRRAGMK